MNAVGDFFGDGGGAAVGGGGNSAGDGFTDDENIGMESVGAGVAAGTGADGVSFGEDAGDVAMGQFPFEGGEVVEFDDASGDIGICGRADIAAARDGGAVGGERDVGFVDGTGIAVVEDQNFRAFGDFAGEADGKTVGVGGGEGELPERQAETEGEFFAHVERVFGGKHEGNSLLGLAEDRFDGGGGRMASHGAGVTEAEVDVVVTVDVGDGGAVGFGDENRKFAGPFFHPVHGDAAEEGFLGAFAERGGFGMSRDEIIFFAGEELAETGAIDGGGGARFAGLRHEWLRSG